ncbi:unnamed protein product, partial [Mesorhabditis spiculigera]
MSTSARLRLLAIGAVLSLLSIFQMGYATAFPNTAIDAFRDYINETVADYGYTLSTETFSWVWSAILDTWFVGFAVGSCLAPILADRMGRKSGLLAGNALNAVSAGLSFCAVTWPSLVLFSISRLLFSLAAAISMNCLILLLQARSCKQLLSSEASPVSMRGVMSFYAEMAFVVTNLFGGMAGMRSVLGTNLPMLTGVAVVLAIASVLVVIPVAESPQFLLNKRNDTEAAAKALFFYQRVAPIEEECLDKGAENEAAGSIMEILRTPHLGKGLLLGLCALQVAVSIWPIVFFSTDLLRRAGIDDDLSELVSTIMLFTSTLCTCLGMVLVEKIGRRTLLIISSLVNISALLLFVVSAEITPFYSHANIGCIIAIMAHGGSYSIALGPIAWFIVSELMPINVRATGQSLALAVNQTIALLLVTVTLPLHDRIGAWSLLILFVVPGTLALIAIYRYLPETRATPIDHVILALKGVKPPTDAVELESPRKS